jgi:hypothetical protein
LWDTSWSWRNCRASCILYNIAKLHGSTPMNKINIWFVRIRKTTVTDVMEQHVNTMAAHLMTGTWSYVDWPWVTPWFLVRYALGFL